VPALVDRRASSVPGHDALNALQRLDPARHRPVILVAMAERALISGAPREDLALSTKREAVGDVACDANDAPVQH